MASYFREKGRINGEQSQGSIDIIIANSTTITLGQAVKVSAGFLVGAATTGKILGIVVGLVDSNGRPLDTTFAKTTYTGTFTSGAPGTQSYAASASNQTVDMVKAIVRYSKETLWVNDTAGTLTTAMLFTSFYVNAAGLQIATSKVGEVAGQFQLIALNPDNDGSVTKGAFIISESQLDAYTVS
jgi:hypothetical protein